MKNLLFPLAVVVTLLAGLACEPERPPIDVGGEGEGEEGEGEGEEGEGEGEVGEGEGEGEFVVAVQPDGFCTGICQVETGATFQLLANVFDADNNLIEEHGAPVWSVDDEAIGTVDQTGLVTGVSPGLLTVTAVVDGVSGQATLDVRGPRPVRVVASVERLDLADGATATITAEVFAEGDVLLPGAPLAFTVGDAGVATVDDNGVVTAVGPGATVVVVFAADGFFILDAVAVRVTSDDAVPAPLLLRFIDAGVHHTCGIASDDRGLCFGDNQFGQLGDGNRTEPGTVNGVAVSIAGGRRWSSLTTGQYFSCGIEADTGASLCWGQGESGQLGADLGGALGSLLPVRVVGGHTFVSLSAGGSHTCGIDDGGDLFCWGFNLSGAVGDGTTENRAAPVEVGAGRSWSEVVTGLFSSCALTDAGEAFCWGENSQGQVGNDDATGASVLAPVRVAPDVRFSTLALTGSHVCGVVDGVVDGDDGDSLDDGRVLCWGDGTFGQLGTGGSVGANRGPVLFDTTLRFVDIAVGAHHSCGVTAAGDVSCWGNNDFSYLGDGTLTSSNGAVAIAVPDDAPVFASIDGGTNHTCALGARIGESPAAEVWCWGSGDTGELGNGRGITFGSFPVRVIAP